MRRAILILVVILVAYSAPRLMPSHVARADSSAEQAIPISPAWPSGVRAFLKLEMSPTVFNVLYHWGRVVPAGNGAYGPNVSASHGAWYLEYQRAGDVDVISGVLHWDASLVATGLKMFHFGLVRETTDGSFPGSVWPFHGTAMFLAQAAPALIVLKYSPLRADFASELAWQVSRMRVAARHLIRVAGGVGKLDDPTKNHRYYEAAMALGATGMLSGDRTLLGWSTRYAWEGIHMERPDGIMPEDGGHDTGYQGLGMMHAARYLTLVATGSLRAALRTALARGEAWELSRVRADGAIDQAGDTRSTGCQERNPEGECKTVMYAPIFDALARWSVIARDVRYRRAAYMVWLQNWKLVPGDVLPPPGLRAQPSTLAPGQWITVSGAGFRPLETVKVYFGTALEQTIQCDQTGAFGGHSSQPNAHFPVPTASAGRYAIMARGSEGTARRTMVTVTG